MASPPLPPVLTQLANRPFSFYPPIQGLPHNQWIFRRATWSELIVVGAKCGGEISIPRHFIGEISHVDDPVLVASLTCELESRDGAVSPLRRRVIEMPVAEAASTPAPRHEAPAPVVAIRLGRRSQSRAVKVVGGALAAAIVLYLAGANVFLLGSVKHRAPSRRAVPHASASSRLCCAN